ncbi:hypothetical protein IFR05_015551 [Cadophora sp. M221]|nr:hypothetical protein IFR05_015551 [Cadophora sp. M221]
MVSSGNFYVQPEYVHRRGWTNWNGNAITGGKITMTKDTAELLNIFIGIFLVFAQAGLWDLIKFWCFILNRRLRKGTTSAPRDLIFHQQQTVLRSRGSPVSLAIAYGKMWKTYGWSEWKIIRRTWPLIGAATLSFGIFLVGVPFITAWILLDNQGVEVLIRSPNCGFWTAVFTDTESDNAAMTILTNQSWEAVSYVDSCYNSDAPSTLCDKFLPQRRLPTFEWSATPCPFDVDVCLHTNDVPAFKMQTEMLDSHKDFGINAPHSDRIQIQRTTICSPLNVTRFTNITKGIVTGEEITGVYFGPVTGENYTFAVSNLEKLATSGYHLSAVSNYVANGTTYSSTFTPIKELTLTNADVSVIFLNNNGIPIRGIDGPITDPFFSATTPSPYDKRFYYPDSPITAIGCTDQYVFGNPVKNQWTDPLPAGTDWANYTKDWGLTPLQSATIATFIWALGQTGAIDRVIMGLETEALLAKKYPGVFAGFQNPISDSQWKKEVDYWFKNGLAKLQLQLISIATGPPDPKLPGLQNALPIISYGRDDLVDKICGWQKVYNVEFKNYHRTGFIVLVVIGSLLVLVPIPAQWIYTAFGRPDEDLSSWNSYEPLKLMGIVSKDASQHEQRNREHDEISTVVEIELLMQGQDNGGPPATEAAPDPAPQAGQV